MFFHLSVRVEQLGSHGTDYEISYLCIFRKPVEKIQVSLKYDQNKGLFYFKAAIHFLSLLAHFFVETEMFQTKAVEDIKKHVL
jgi:hypothetical protein